MATQRSRSNTELVATQRRVATNSVFERACVTRARSAGAPTVGRSLAARSSAGVGRYRCGVPEGHTIHRLAGRHAELFVGDKVQPASPQGRFAEGAARLSGTVLDGTEAYGKHLLHHYAHELTLHVHLGLYGKFADGPGEPPPPVGQVRLRLTSDAYWLDLRGPTACELLTPPEVAALRARLGPDPLRADADPYRAYARISRSPTPLAALLLDQSVVAGTGLIFVRRRCSGPACRRCMPGRELTPALWRELWADLWP